MQFAIVTVLAVVAVCTSAMPIAIDSGFPFKGEILQARARAVGGGFEQAGEFSREVEGGGGEFKPLINPLIPSQIRSIFKSVAREWFM